MVQAALSRGRSIRFGQSLLGLALLACTSACVSATYQRVNLNEPRSDEVVQPLLDTPSDLGRCLDALGAPNLVWPTTNATALAWAHTHEAGWGLRVATSVRQVTASVTYNSALQKAQAIVLFFDDDWNLLYLRRGKLADLIQENPRRVQPVEPRPGAGGSPDVDGGNGAGEADGAGGSR